MGRDCWEADAGPEESTQMISEASESLPSHFLLSSSSLPPSPLIHYLLLRRSIFLQKHIKTQCTSGDSFCLWAQTSHLDCTWGGQQGVLPSSLNCAPLGLHNSTMSCMAKMDSLQGRACWSVVTVSSSNCCWRCPLGTGNWPQLCSSPLRFY